MIREDAGPFLILGIDKDANNASVEAQYESRMSASQRGELKWSASDLEWAREQLLNADRRVVADADSWNTDIASGDVHRLIRLYRMENTSAGWEPLDPEPPAELPITNIDMDALVAELPLPDAPLELPAIARWLERCGAVGLDPWSADVFGN